MVSTEQGHIAGLLTGILGDRGDAILRMLAIAPDLFAESGERVSRAAFAMALNALLFDDLLRRVPSGAAYVDETVRTGGRVTFDHGALRTIRFGDGPTGALPAGQEAFRRILEPIGYVVADLYPLPALRMTGHAYRHVDAPEAIPQFFVSELHVDRYDAAFGAVTRRVFGASRDPLDAATLDVLGRFAAEGGVARDDAAIALPRIAAAFGRHHDLPHVHDYRALLAQSSEAAWIATEGNAFNHATDRVPNVDAVAQRLRAQGYPIKDKVETSRSGRVRQTALRAGPVPRDLPGGAMPAVPGSFYEFISRDRDPATGALDLRFDSNNATNIFAMTKQG